MADGRRGRPKRNAIDRINIAIDLKDNRKFSLLMEYSGLTEGPVLLMLWGLWQFTGSNYAFDGDCVIEHKENGEIEVMDWINPRLTPEDGPGLRRACCFVGQSETLISWLQRAGFLDEDLTVVGWFENQPLAAKLVVKRKLGQLGGKKTAQSHVPRRGDSGHFTGSERAENASLLPLDSHNRSVDNLNRPNQSGLNKAIISDDSLPLKSGSLPISDDKNGTQSLIPNPKEEMQSTGVDCGERRGEPPPTPVQANPSESSNGHKPFAQTAETIAMFLEEVSELVTLNNNDQTGLASDVKAFLTRASPDDWQNLRHWITEQLRIAKREGRLNVEEHGIKNPVAWIRSQIKSEPSPLQT